jgi:hypothetical protein
MRKNVSIYVCVHVCIYLHTCTYMYAYTCTYSGEDLELNPQYVIYVGSMLYKRLIGEAKTMAKPPSICTYIHIYIYTYIHIYKHIYIYINIHIYIYD